MKVDYIYGNPPYDGDLHLKILNFCMDKATRIVWLHPARWIQSITSNKTFHWLDNKIVDVDLIKANTKELFNGMDISGNLIISTIENNSENSVSSYNPLSFRVCFPNPDLDLEIYNKIMKKCDKTIKDFIKLEPLKKNAVVISLIGGNGGMNNAMISKLVTSNQDCVYVDGMADGKTFAERRSAGSPDKDFVEHVQFDTKEEAESFLASLKTPIYIFINSVSKCDMHVHPDYLPFLNYKTLWTEDSLSDYFELLPEERNEIESIVNNPKNYKIQD